VTTNLKTLLDWAATNLPVGWKLGFHAAVYGAADTTTLAIGLHDPGNGVRLVRDVAGWAAAGPVIVGFVNHARERAGLERPHAPKPTKSRKPKDGESYPLFKE
jgi:hypothetical protein